MKTKLSAVRCKFFANIIRSGIGAQNHPYSNFQKQSNENNEFLSRIPNTENIRSFMLPAEFVRRRFDVIQDHVEKEFSERGMRNILCENTHEYAKIHK